MGEQTGIAWCDHTFNPWWGCIKVSPACDHCYAEAMDKRVGGDHWGKGTSRRVMSANYWRQPTKWNRLAMEAKRRARVFCASMADVFEDHPDVEVARERLWLTIAETPWLDWLLLTKRPENLSRFVPWMNGNASINTRLVTPDRAQPWRNVWLGSTVENNKFAARRLPHLIAAPAVVRFVSAEPLLERLVMKPEWRAIDWWITGCESGAGARPQNVDDFRALRDWCAAERRAFFFKQAELDNATGHGASFVPAISVGIGSFTKNHGKLVELPYLDGAIHDEFPMPRIP